MLSRLPSELVADVLSTLRDESPADILNVRLVNRQLYDQSFDVFAQYFFTCLPLLMTNDGMARASEIVALPRLPPYVRRIRLKELASSKDTFVAPRQSPPRSMSMKQKLRLLQSWLSNHLVNCRTIEGRFHLDYNLDAHLPQIAQFLSSVPFLSCQLDHCLVGYDPCHVAYTWTGSWNASLQSLSLSLPTFLDERIRAAVNIISLSPRLKHLCLSDGDSLCHVANRLSRESMLPALQRLRITSMRLVDDRHHEMTSVSTLFTRLSSSLTVLELENLEVHRRADATDLFEALRATEFENSCRLSIRQWRAWQPKDAPLPFCLGDMDLDGLNLVDSRFALQQFHGRSVCIGSEEVHEPPFIGGSLTFRTSTASEMREACDVMITLCQRQMLASDQGSLAEPLYCGPNYQHIEQVRRMRQLLGTRYIELSDFDVEDWAILCESGEEKKRSPYLL